MRPSTESNETAKELRQPVHFRLPGFISDKETGLGDIIKRATKSIGITPCAACEERAKVLNQWVVFGPDHS